MPEKIGLGSGLPFSERAQTGGGGGPALLSPGVYWANESVSLGPYVGNYAATTKLTDGNTADGESGSAGDVTWVHVLSSPLSLSTWQTTVYFVGGLNFAWSYWNGSAWTPILESGDSLAPFNMSYGPYTKTASFLSLPTAGIFRAVATSTGTVPAIMVTDSHLS